MGFSSPVRNDRADELSGSDIAGGQVWTPVAPRGAGAALMGEDGHFRIAATHMTIGLLVSLSQRQPQGSYHGIGPEIVHCKLCRALLDGRNSAGRPLARRVRRSAGVAAAIQPGGITATAKSPISRAPGYLTSQHGRLARSVRQTFSFASKLAGGVWRGCNRCIIVRWPPMKPSDDFSTPNETTARASRHFRDHRSGDRGVVEGAGRDDPSQPGGGQAAAGIGSANGVSDIGRWWSLTGGRGGAPADHASLAAASARACAVRWLRSRGGATVTRQAGGLASSGVGTGLAPSWRAGCINRCWC